MTIENLASMPDAEIQSTIEALQSELGRRRNEQQALRVSIHYAGYNERRYSRPWIARVTAWPVGGRAALDWGRYLGGDSGGEVEIMARPGDIIRHGQKDTRGSNGSSEWAVVQADGSIHNLTEAEARQTYKGGN